jgi:plasmid stabilization system protein ParE
VKARYLAEAREDVRAGMEWYETKGGRGQEFEEAVENAVAKIAERPERWALWPGKPGKLGLHRYLMRKRKRWDPRGWPYKIAYEIKADEVVIVAVTHEKRRPNYWIKRVPRSP